MKILVIDDDPDLVEAIQIGMQLQWQGVEVISALDGERGIKKFEEENPNLILLDITMPGRDGYSVLKAIRRTNDVPIIMISSHGSDEEKVKSLELGADDYLVKPFSYPELFARIKAVLRRMLMPAPVNNSPSFVLGDVSINFENRELSKNGQVVNLTPIEANILFLLVQNAGRVLTFEYLLNKIWGSEQSGQIAYLKTYISRLRKKLEDNPESPTLIQTERGLGYRLVKPE